MQALYLSGSHYIAHNGDKKVAEAFKMLQDLSEGGREGVCI